MTLFPLICPFHSQFFKIYFHFSWIHTQSSWEGVGRLWRRVFRGGVSVAWGQELIHMVAERDSQKKKRYLVKLTDILPWPLHSQIQNQPVLCGLAEKEAMVASMSWVLGAFPWYQEEQFSAELTLHKGEYKRCTQIEYNQVLFKFFFIFLHTGKSSEGA